MKIAIVGATGVVGESLIALLERKKVDATYCLFASSKSKGKIVEICGKGYVVDSIENCHDCKVDVAFMMCSAQLSKAYTPIFLANGATVIDNSSCFRLQDDVPLVVDSINGQLAVGKRLVCNPNCTTIAVAMVLDALGAWDVSKAIVSTYQAVSGAGREGLCDLHYKSSYGSLKCFDHPIYDNVIPAIDSPCDNGYTAEEMKMTNECKKLLGKDIDVSCTAVRVPVSVGHSCSMCVELNRRFEVEQIVSALMAYPNIIVANNLQMHRYPMPIVAKNSPFVYVGRLRKDITASNRLSMFVSSDNLLRGASFNAYEIFRRIVNA